MIVLLLQRRESTGPERSVHTLNLLELFEFATTDQRDSCFDAGFRR